MPVGTPAGGTFGGWQVAAADLLLDNNRTMALGVYDATVRYRLNYIPEEIIDRSDVALPAFCLQTYPSTDITPDVDDASRQNLLGPSWEMPTIGVWASHTFRFQVGTCPFTMSAGTIAIPSSWVGTLYSFYGRVQGLCSDGWYHSEFTPGGYPINISKVDVTFSTSNSKITGTVSSIHFS